MKQSIIELAFINQIQNGVLSEQTKIEEDRNWSKIDDQVKKLVTEEVYRLVMEIEELLSEEAAVGIERAYRVGFEDGVSISNQIKALN